MEDRITKKTLLASLYAFNAWLRRSNLLSADNDIMLEENSPWGYRLAIKDSGSHLTTNLTKRELQEYMHNFMNTYRLIGAKEKNG